MFIIAKSFEFSASHILEGLPEGHKCGRLHGHNYVVDVQLGALRLDEHGFVFDYGDLDPVKAMLDKNFDHRHLNDVVDFQPSAENLAKHLFERIALLLSGETIVTAVRVHETPKTVAEYRPTTDDYRLRP